MRFLLLLVILILSYGRSVAQHEYDVWYFGEHFVVDFRSRPPTVTKTGPADAQEGYAVYGDPITGEPKIIVAGDNDIIPGRGRIYDRNGNVMPNGDGLFTSFSSSQAALIVPWPCHPGQFFVVTTDQQGYFGPSRGSHYNIVDLSLNGGLGDVTAKNIPLNSSTDEHLTAVHYPFGEDYWVLLHSNMGNTFYAYRVTKYGITTSPVISAVGTPLQPGYSLGYLKASPNGKKLAIAGSFVQIVELFDFDPFTGKVSNPTTLFRGQDISGNNPYGPYGVCFSPDNSKLYYSGEKGIYQCDLSGTKTDILNSRRRVDQTMINYYAAALSPEGKIYFISLLPALSVIENPNAKGDLCGFREWGLKLSGRQIGLPNMIEGSMRSLPELMITNGNADTVIVTDKGIISSIRVSSEILFDASTLYGHTSPNVVLDAAVVDGKSVAFTHRANGAFEISTGSSSSDVVLTFSISSEQGTVVIDSVAIEGGSVSFCEQYSHNFTVTPSCFTRILSKFMKTGKVPDFTISPNPAENRMVIKSTVDAKDAVLEIYDQLGRKIFTQNYDFSNTQPCIMSVNAFPNGQYLLRVASNGFCSTRVFVISR